MQIIGMGFLAVLWNLARYLYQVDQKYMQE